MARPLDHDKRKAAPVKDAGAQEQEETAPEREAPEPEHSRLQNQIGNSGLAAILADQQQGHDGEGQGGASLQRRAELKGPTHGGDDDVVDDGLLTVEELLGSANPGTSAGDDRPAFAEAIPDEELPPEDEELLASLPSEPEPIALPATRAVDALLQPSTTVIGASLSDWSAGVARWSSPTLPWRAVAAMLRPAAPALQDPSGFVLAGRARAAAIATWVLLESPALAADPSPATAALANFCLECEGRRSILRAVDATASSSSKKMPLAARLFEIDPAEAPTHLRPQPLNREARTWLLVTIEALVALPNASMLVPPAEAMEPLDAEDDDDDPLGLDNVLRELTGGEVDPDAGAMRSIMASAEGLASLSRRARIAFAGLAHILRDVGATWSHGAPHRELLEVLNRLDEALVEALQILVDVARATQAKRFAPSVLGKGLVRGARAIERAIRATHDPLVGIVSGLLPAGAAPTPVPQTPQDALHSALSEGQPANALPWLAKHEERDEARIASAFVRVAAGQPPAVLIPALRETHDHAVSLDEHGLASVAHIVLGPLLLGAGDAEGALAIAEEQLALGLSRRNGILAAQAHLLQLDALVALGREAELPPIRRRVANALWRMGARGPLSLVLRQRPEPEELEES